MAGGDIYGLLKVDQQKKLEGTEVQVGDGISIRVARFPNPRFQEYWRQITVPFRRQIENETISEEDMRTLMIDALAHTVLLDWEGITVKGKPFPYSVENAIKLMTDLEEFRDIVADEARRFANFRAEQVEDERGNSFDTLSST